ncbi:MAG: phage major capsid protein [Acidaminococcaceae bacterium]
MDKILELRQKQAAAAKKLRAMVDKAMQEKRSLTTEEDGSYQALVREANEYKAAIAVEEQIRAIEGDIPNPPNADEEPEGGQRGIQVIMDPQKDLEPGIRMARCAKVKIVAEKRQEKIGDVMKRMYPDDKILRSSMSTASGSGGALIPANLYNEIIPLLRQVGVIRGLGAREIPISNGNMTIPKATGAANFTWIGEKAPIVASAPSLGNVSFAAKKMAGLIPVPTELLEDSSIAADAYVRDELVNGAAEAEDVTMIYGSGTSFTPKGLKTLCLAQAATIDGLISEEVVVNLMTKVLSSKLNNPKLGWMLPGILWGALYQLRDATGRSIFKDEMKDGKLLGAPFKVNNNITINADANKTTDIWLGDFNNLLIGAAKGVSISMSTEASYKDGDETLSAFQNDMTLMRVLVREDFATRYVEAFASATVHTVTGA